MHKIKQYGLALGAVLLPVIARAELSPEVTAFKTELTNKAAEIGTYIWIGATAFVAVFIAYISVKVMLRGVKSVA